MAAPTGSGGAGGSSDAKIPVEVSPLQMAWRKLGFLTSSDLIKFDSAEGQKRLLEAEHQRTSHYHLIGPHFRKQRGDTACGVATAATVIEALTALTTGKSDTKFTEAKFLDDLSESYAKQISWAKIREEGMTLFDLELLFKAKSQSLQSVVSAHSISHTLTAAEQSKLLTDCFTVGASGGPISFVTANYYIPGLGIGYTIDGGHHSPLVAYHHKTYSVLLMDVWKPYAHVWVPLNLLLEAMDTIDSDSNRRRGFIIVNFVPAVSATATATATATAAAPTTTTDSDAKHTAIRKRFTDSVDAAAASASVKLSADAAKLAPVISGSTPPAPSL